MSPRTLLAGASTMLSGSYLLARHSPLANAWLRRGAFSRTH